MPETGSPDQLVSIVYDGLIVDADSPLPVSLTGPGGAGASQVAPIRGSLTDHSGELAAGATSQEVMAANTSRSYLLFVNDSSETQWINFGTAAVASRPSIPVTAGGSFVMEDGFVSTQSLNVISATTGSDYTAKEG